MAQRYDFKTTAGSTLIPIANGTHYCDGIDEGLASGEVFVKVLAADGVTQIAASGGTITFTGSPDGAQYLAATANGTVTCTTLEIAGATSTYVPPTFSYSVRKLAMTLASVAGTNAVYVQAWTIRR